MLSKSALKADMLLLLFGALSDLALFALLLLLLLPSFDFDLLIFLDLCYDLLLDLDLDFDFDFNILDTFLFIRFLCFGEKVLIFIMLSVSFSLSLLSSLLW